MRICTKDKDASGPSLNPSFTEPHEMHPLELLAVWNRCEIAHIVLAVTWEDPQDCVPLTELPLEHQGDRCSQESHTEQGMCLSAPSSAGPGEVGSY